ncbi:MAG TPA: hypothetical protein VGL56_16060 [Fimbriimonadaceae bacterium]|jgi:hypothetical protein
MDNGLYLVLPIAFLMGTFWLYAYCYGLYRLGRAIAQRYRTRPIFTFVLIAIGSAILSAACLFLPVDPIWKSAIVFGVWITHTQAIGSGFWGGMEVGKKDDDVVFKERAESWLSEWEEPAEPTKNEPD